MSRAITASLVVGFDSKVPVHILLEEDDERDTEYFYERYVRVYSGGKVPLLRAIGGTFVKRGSDVHEVREVLNFSNSDTVHFKYPAAYNVRVEDVSVFYDSVGNLTNNKVVIDEASNGLKAVGAVYGIVTVSYKSNYAVHLFTHKSIGGGCPPPGQPINPDEKYFEVGLIIGYLLGDSSSLSLDPPDCTARGFGANILDRDRVYPKMILEVDPERRSGLYSPGENPEIEPSKSAENLLARTMLRLYPAAETVSFVVNRGEFAISSEVFYREVSENLIFQGSSVELSYTPTSVVSVEPVTPLLKFVDQFGGYTVRGFSTPGEQVQDVNWISSNLYTLGNKRLVGPSEVIATDSFDRTVDCYGVIRATYTTAYKLIHYEHDIDDPNVPTQFMDAYAVCFRTLADGTIEAGGMQISAHRLAGEK